MLQTSQDILFLCLAVSIVAIAVFICLALYYLIRMLKRANDFTEGLNNYFEKFDEILETIKQKISLAVPIGVTMSKLIIEAINLLKNRKKEARQISSEDDVDEKRKAKKEK